MLLIKGFHNVGVELRPEWVTGDLHLWYFQLRVERPRGAKRRRLYRLIEKEKLRLAELCICQELILATCRYLSSYSVVSGKRMVELMNRPVVQLSFNFHEHHF